MATTILAHTTALRKREQIAEGTIAFHFEKPAGFEFRAGQFLDWTLINPLETDAEGNTRAFSIVSAPFESDVIATRMRDTAFKRVLRSMPLGTEVKIDGPSGSFTLHKNSAKPAVFLAGGIGITPFVSMVAKRPMTDSLLSSSSFIQTIGPRTPLSSMTSPTSPS